jgi:WD40 repeat protein/tRNA A-37 threonylcarbamoyl transferase component Bud32
MATIKVTIPDEPASRESKVSPAPFQIFGDYELAGEIARGGMGVVFKARQRSLNRIVAVKMIRGERLVGEDEVRRFHVEASAAAQLHHPNIVAIHEVGEVEGQHFYSMNFVAGRSLSDLAREKTMAPRQAARYVEKIARAIHYAHGRQILHRDLKPANVLIDQDDEPQVTDFGLAKVMQTEAGATLSGTIMGSPSYMPPEQARGDTRTVDVRSDVYGLGAVLYELLCGRPPFRAETPLETLRLVVEKDPVAPRLLHPKLPRDLETICLKCLEKPRERRYATALDLANELARFQNHEPILARPVGVPARVFRWCRRKPALASVGAAALLLMLVIAIGSPIAAFRINRARVLAEEGEINARRNELNARRNAYGADMGLVRQAIDQRRFSYAEQLLLSHRPAPGQTDVRGWEWRYLWEQWRGPPVTPLARHSGEISGINVSPDGRWIASQDNTGTLKLWSVPAKREVLEIKDCSGPAPALSDKLMAAFDARGLIRFWSLATLETNGPPIKHPGGLSSIQFHPSGESLITYGGKRLQIWDVSSRQMIREHTIPRGPVMALARDGTTLAVSSGQREITVWRADTGDSKVFISGHVFTGQPFCLALSGDGRTLAAAGVAFGVGTDYRVQVWNLETGLQTTNFPAHVDRVTSARFSADDSHLVTTSYDQIIEVRERERWGTVAMMKAGGWPSSITLLPQAGLLLTGGRDGQVEARELHTDFPMRDKLPMELASEIVSETRGGIAPDASVVAALRADGTGVLIDPRAGGVRKKLALPLANVSRVAVGPAGRLLAIESGEGLGLWESAGATRVAELEAPPGKHWSSLTFSSDGRWLAGVLSQRHTFHLWSLTPPFEAKAWNESPTNVATVQFSPDSTQVAFGYNTGTISVWEVSAGRRLVDLAGHEGQINRLAISRDGKQLASTSYDATVRVWDLATRREIARFRGSRTSFFRVSFSPDGKRLFVNEWSDALLFDLEANRQVARLKSFTPLFLDEDTVLGLSEKDLWHWRPPALAEIDAEITRSEP